MAAAAPSTAPKPGEVPRFDPKAPQSVEFYDGQGPVHRSARSPQKLLGVLPGEANTLWENIRPVFEQRASLPCLGVREVLPDGKSGNYVWKTFTDVGRTVRDFASGLRQLGLNPRDRIGVYAKNTPEWGYTFLAGLSNNQVLVPLYDTLGPDATAYVVNHAELHTVVASCENAGKLLTQANELPTLKRVIAMTAPTAELSAKATKAGVELLAFSAVADLGARHPRASSPATPDDLFTIMYTSGTTGVPKGALLTNANGVATLTSSKTVVAFVDGDTYLSYLPMAHVMEMIVFLVAMAAGAQIGFWRGDTALLVEDLAALRPTVLIGVPRVFNRIYDRIHAQIAQASLVKRQLFNYAFSAKLSALRESGELHHALWDRLVFSKISAVVGGRVRFILSGSAPLSSSVQDFLRIVFACPVVQGYGLTETTAALTLQDLGDTSSGNVGAPQVCTEVKLVDVPEMGYTSGGRVQQGEICARGPSIFRGYYKMPEKTAEDVDRDGWFHTGDIGEWLPNGALKIIDRKKNIFKLSQGEYVAAEYLETVYLKSRFVAQIFVYGDSLRSTLVAIVVPDVDVLLPWAKKQGFPENVVELCKDERARKAVYASMMKVAQDANLKGFEKVKAIHLEAVPWAPENLLTPTMKMRRAEAKKHYAAIIDKLYSEVKPDAKL